MQDKGMTPTQIIAETGLSRTVVYEICRVRELAQAEAEKGQASEGTE